MRVEQDFVRLPLLFRVQLQTAVKTALDPFADEFGLRNGALDEMPHDQARRHDARRKSRHKNQGDQQDKF
jgi:hypothetical protein